MFQGSKALLHTCLPRELYCSWVSRLCLQFTFCHLYISAPHMMWDHLKSFSLHRVPCPEACLRRYSEGWRCSPVVHVCLSVDETQRNLGLMHVIAGFHRLVAITSSMWGPFNLGTHCVQKNSYLVAFRAHSKAHVPNLISAIEQPCSDSWEVVLFPHP